MSQVKILLMNGEADADVRVMSCRLLLLLFSFSQGPGRYEEVLFLPTLAMFNVWLLVLG